MLAALITRVRSVTGTSANRLVAYGVPVLTSVGHVVASLRRTADTARAVGRLSIRTSVAHAIAVRPLCEIAVQDGVDIAALVKDMINQDDMPLQRVHTGHDEKEDRRIMELEGIRYILRAPDLDLNTSTLLKPKVVTNNDEFEIEYDTLCKFTLTADAAEIVVKNGACSAACYVMTAIETPYSDDPYLMWNTSEYAEVKNVWSPATAAGASTNLLSLGDSHLSAFVYVSSSQPLLPIARGVVSDATSTLDAEFSAQSELSDVGVRAYVISPHLVRWIVTATVMTPWYTFTSDVDVRMSVQLRIRTGRTTAPSVSVWAGSHVAPTASCIFQRIKRSMVIAERTIERTFVDALASVTALPAGVELAIDAGEDGDLWLCQPAS